MRQLFTDFIQKGNAAEFWSYFDSCVQGVGGPRNVREIASLMMTALAFKSEQEIAMIDDLNERLYTSREDLSRYGKEHFVKINTAVTSLNEFCSERDRLIASSPSFKKFKAAIHIAKLYARDVAKRYDCDAEMAIGLDEFAKRAGPLTDVKVSKMATIVFSRGFDVPKKGPEDLFSDKLKRVARQLESGQPLDESKKLSDTEKAALEGGRVTKEEEAVILLRQLLDKCALAFDEWQGCPEYKDYEVKKKAMETAIFEVRRFCTPDELYKHAALSKDAAARLKKMIA